MTGAEGGVRRSDRPAGVVGIIANPAAGKDVRRLVAHGTSVDNQGKVGIVRRALAGLAALGVERVLLMPDTHRITQRAVEGLAADGMPPVALLDMAVGGDAEDTSLAARLMAEAGAGCLIVLGGDGTARVAAHGAGQVPILPISTGTNNVLPTFVEGTVAGLAAAAVARGWASRGRELYRHKRLQVLRSEGSLPLGDALVDVAALSGAFVGARAVWDATRLRQAVVTRASPASIGISAIVGAARSISPREPLGAAVVFGEDGRRLRAAVAPGLVAELPLAELRELRLGEGVRLVSERPLVLALDGERDVVLYDAAPVEVRLMEDGPWIVDVEAVMARLAREGRLYAEGRG